MLRGKEKFYPSDSEELDIYLKDCIEYLREGLHANGVNEPVRELKMERSDWGFKIKDISKTPVHFWHGKKDKLIPIKLVKVIASEIGNVQVHEAANKGHFLWLNDDIWIEILSTLVKHFKQ